MYFQIKVEIIENATQDNEEGGRNDVQVWQSYLSRRIREGSIVIYLQWLKKIYINNYFFIFIGANQTIFSLLKNKDFFTKVL